MQGQRLYKIEKLRSEIAIGQLFDRSNPAVDSIMAYPLRASWKLNGHRDAQCPQFLVSIPKKRIRHAVDRVLMRRRVREAYRLNRDLFPSDMPIDLAFVYVANEVLPYSRVESAVKKILGNIGAKADIPKDTD
ncbi:MAG: ribonuclease P protein component [Duncaniella sp.]|nr:ribonuclease P protein component [Duncaniella sp.]MDE7145124.1 ribonuclease P protein component [Duncaniella sp.]